MRGKDGGETMTEIIGLELIIVLLAMGVEMNLMRLQILGNMMGTAMRMGLDTGKCMQNLM